MKTNLFSRLPSNSQTRLLRVCGLKQEQMSESIDSSFIFSLYAGTTQNWPLVSHTHIHYRLLKHKCAEVYRPEHITRSLEDSIGGYNIPCTSSLSVCLYDASTEWLIDTATLATLALFKSLLLSSLQLWTMKKVDSSGIQWTYINNMGHFKTLSLYTLKCRI